MKGKQEWENSKHPFPPVFYSSTLLAARRSIFYHAIFMVDVSSDGPVMAPLPSKRNPLAWLALFGPGAIIASVTIGTGELIFSSRGGALFGYRVLFLFVFVSALKWAMVLATSRHMVLTGVHPYRRMMDLPGPRGWFPLMLFLLAAVCLPIWVSFHSGVLGNLMAQLTKTSKMFNGGMDYLWGATILAGVLILTATGGYSILERIQILIVGALIICAGITLLIYNPNWLELLEGAFIPRPFEYPQWLYDVPEYQSITSQSVWVETTRYVGVIGGAGFDYLAYTSFLRDKSWGRSALGPATAPQMDQIAADPNHPVRRWLRAPLIDLTISFILVVAFSAVFVAAGTIFLGPHKKVPDGNNFLTLQSAFVTSIHTSPLAKQWLSPLYFTGAFLTMLGTLYGTLEIGHSIVSEMIHTVNPDLARRRARCIRLVTVAWCAVGAVIVLSWCFLHQYNTGDIGKPRLLLAILTPANLFTGVFFCGLICLLIPWMEWRFLPRSLRLPRWLVLVNIFSATIFLFLGVKGFWEHPSRWLAIGGMVGAAVVGICGAAMAARRLPND